MGLPHSASFKHLGLVFHESGSMLPAFAKLAQNGKGAAASSSAKHKALMRSKSFSLMRRLFDAVVRPTVSYGCEVWAPACFLTSHSDNGSKAQGHAGSPDGILSSALKNQNERHAQHLQ